MKQDKLDELINQLARDFHDMEEADKTGNTDLRELRHTSIRFAINKYAEERA